MKKQIVRNYPQFTHFASIPLISYTQRKKLTKLQENITFQFAKHQLQKALKPNNPFLFHLTLSMLTIPHAQTQQKVIKIIQTSLKQQIQKIMSNTVIALKNLRYFTRFNKNLKRNQVSVIFLDLQEGQAARKISNAIDLLIKCLIKQQIISQQQLKSMRIFYDHKSGMFKSNQLHVTLFRVQGLEDDEKFREIFDQIKLLNKQFKLIYRCEFFDISTRFHYDQTKFYKPLHRVQLQASQ